jgi:regulator of cell morphogenesis and NO signaling
MRKRLERATVGEIVASDWRAAAIFEQYGIDFCSGGRRTLSEACRSAGTDIANLHVALEELAATEADRGAASWPIDQLIDHVMETHHAYLRSALPRILRYLSKLTHVHGTRHPELARMFEVFEVMSRDLLHHLRKEEGALFPYVRELEYGLAAPSPHGTVRSRMRMMERDHEHIAEQLREIARLSRHYTPPPDACSAYRACFDELRWFEQDLDRHMHLENDILFPRAVALEASRGSGSAASPEPPVSVPPP